MPVFRPRYLIVAIAALGLIDAFCGGDDDATATAPATAVAATSTMAPAATATPTPEPTAMATATATATPASTASPTPTPEPTATPAPAARASDIQNTAFEGRIEVEAGTTVTWTNQDGFAHTVTATDRSADSGTLGQGGTF
jgi:plastocyanin